MLWCSGLYLGVVCVPITCGWGHIEGIVLGVVIMVFHCPLWHWLPVAGLMCDTLVRVLFLSPAARGGWFSVTLEMASGRPSPLLVDSSFTLLSRFILLSSVVRLESVVAVAAANDAAVSVNSTVGLLLSLKTGGEVAGKGWVCWVGLMLLQPWSDASALNSCSGELCNVSIRCDVCRECDEGVGIESPKRAVGKSGVGGVNQYMIAGHICWLGGWIFAKVAGAHALKILFRALDVGGCCVGVLFCDVVKILEDMV